MHILKSNKIPVEKVYDNNEKTGKVVLESGEYAILYPNDIHKPGMTFGNEPTNVKKIVVKIKI